MCTEKLTCSETVSLVHPKKCFQTGSMPPQSAGGHQQRDLPGARQEQLLGTGTAEGLIKDGALGI